MYHNQRALMYFPQKSAEIIDSRWKKIIYKGKYVGVESRENYKKTAIVFHGNVGNADLRHYYKGIIPEDYRLVVAEYPGFGLNSTEEISKSTMLNRSRDIIKYVKNNSDKVVVIGESLGTGIASQMAAEFNIKKLILLTPYSSIADVAQERFWYLPVSWLIKDNFTNMVLENYKGHTLMLISEKDQVIPPKFADKLYKIIAGPKDKIIIAGASHNNWLELMKKEQLQTIKKFIVE